MITFLLVLRFASYAMQRSSGAPLVVSGHIDTAAVQHLSQFDIVALEATPWAQDVNGAGRADVPLMLRRFHPGIKLFMYVLAGDQWLPPGFQPQPGDHSGFRDIYDAVDKSGGWLWGTDSLQWFENYRVNLGNAATVDSLASVYARLVGTHLFDGMFLDDCHTSIAWTDGSGSRRLDYQRAGFRSLVAMDSARSVNVTRLLKRIHGAGGAGFRVAINGTGPTPKGVDIDFREGLGSLISVEDATAWMARPGTHWLKAECWDDCLRTGALLKAIARRRGIVSCGPDRGWPPVKP